jgi:hypothetical protein
MKSETRNPKSEIEWLPDMDLNHDKVIQSHLCYRYTIGHAGASGKLEGFAKQSRRQSGVRAMLVGNVYASPHPGPLPRGEGERATAKSLELREGFANVLTNFPAARFTFHVS